MVFSFVALLFKVSMMRYDISSSENIYYSSIIVLGLFYLGVQRNNGDILNIPDGLHWWLLLRIVTGVLSDWLCFLAFQYTSYSKAICIFFTNTLMIPFFARCIIKERIYKSDVVAILMGFIGMMFTLVPFKDFESLMRAIKGTSSSTAASVEDL